MKQQLGFWRGQQNPKHEGKISENDEFSVETECIERYIQYNKLAWDSTDIIILISIGWCFVSSCGCHRAISETNLWKKIAVVDKLCINCPAASHEKHFSWHSQIWGGYSII